MLQKSFPKGLSVPVCAGAFPGEACLHTLKRFAPGSRLFRKGRKTLYEKLPIRIKEKYFMSATRRLFLSLTILTLGLFMVCASSFAQEARSTDKPVVAFKGPQLKDWQNASENERYSFLVGVVTMFEAEREWQSPKMLPVRQSAIGLWAKGLMGVTFKDMHDAINAYIVENPGDMDEQVLIVLGRIYVRPAITEQDMAHARAKVAELEKRGKR